MKKGPFFWVTISCGVMIMAFILLPLIQMVLSPSMKKLYTTIKDKDVLKSIWLSIYASGLAAIISFVIGTPFAYFLARKDFWGKNFVESIIDIPIVIPHPVVGIAILSVTGKDYWIGQILHEVGIRIMGSTIGIVTVLVFVGMPFYINTAREGFKSISPRLENVSRSLGASMISTFFRITFPLAWRSIIVGMIMCCARAISEFGAVVIVAYHPMVAPVLIYERFETLGLSYSQPVAVWLILVCLVLFLILRIISTPQKRGA